VPRHPERFDGVAALIDKQNFRFVRRSTGQLSGADTEVVLGDTMGELMTFYAAADVAFVGGSLVKIGGHNLLEPAAFRLPIITGPYTYNAADIAQLFQEDGVALEVNNAAELAAAVSDLFADPVERERIGNRAEALTERSRGALARLLALLDPLLS
jgi:3-deoxy-D-manno-octulosonic-acid transferase